MAKVGAARIFFDVVGQFQAQRLLGDTEAAATVQKAIMMDAYSGIADAFQQTADMILAGVQQMTDAFFEYEEQLIRVRKFYNASSTEVQEFADAAKEMGLAFAFTGAESLAAAARTSQLKSVLKSQNAVIEATRQGLMMAAVGEMETEMGMNRFIALAQQTGFMYGGLTKAQFEAMDAERQANIVRETSIRTLDQLNTVENSSVATMEDITFVLNQFASQADIAGESIGEMASMSALLLETGEEVSRAGTGLRMIYQRLGNANNEATKAIAELIPELDAQGVAQLKLSDVIKMIAPAYNEMEAAEKRALAVNIAGSRHYIKFLKIMENQTRLTELQTAAFEGQYGAIEEFENKQKSATFQAQQMQAELENMRVELGERLAPAFMTAFRAEEMFLNATTEIIDLPGFQNLIGGAIGLSNAFDKIVRPVTDMGLNLFNVVVAMKTLKAVQPENMKNIMQAASKYRQQSMAMQENALVQQSLVNVTQLQMQSQNMLQSSMKRAASESVREARVNLSLAKTELETRKELLRQRMREHAAKAHGASGKEAAMAQKNLTKARAEYVSVETKLTNVIAKKQVLLDKAIANDMLEQSISQGVVASKKGRLIMEQRGLDVMTKSVIEQRELNQGIQLHSKLLGEEVVLYKQLAPATFATLQIKQSELLLDQNRAKARLATLHGMKAELIANGQDTIAIDQKIANTKELIMTMGQERAQITALIHAHNTHTQALKANQNQQITLSATIKATTKNFFAQGGAAKAATSAIMPMTMILPMITEESKVMSAMMYGMGLMMIGTLIPAFKATQKAIAATGAVAASTATVLSALTMGIAALAIYEGFQLFDTILGDKFESDIGRVAEMNAELDKTAMLLTDLQGGAAKGEVFAPLFGDMTFEDLKKNSDLAGNTVDTLRDRIAGLTEDRQKLINVGDIEGAAAMGSEIANLTTILDKTNAIHEAQRIIESDGKRVQLLGDGSYQLLEEAEGKFYNMGKNLGNIITSDAHDYTLKYTDIHGDAVEEQFDLYEDAQKRIIELTEGQYVQLDDLTIDYYKNLLAVQNDANSDMLDADRQLYNDLINEQNQFANAREELFFGQRANFTGAIYKQVTQGGVESLLHKVEIVQSNTFNGYNTEEMVERVTKGVLDEMRAQGITV